MAATHTSESETSPSSNHHSFPQSPENALSESAGDSAPVSSIHCISSNVLGKKGGDEEEEEEEDDDDEQEEVGEENESNAGNPSPITPHSVAAALSRTIVAQRHAIPSNPAGLGPREGLTQPEPERHRLLATGIDLGESPSRRVDDEDWEDLYALIPVVIILMAVIAIAFLLWPIVSFDGRADEIVAAGDVRVLSIDTEEFSLVSVNAEILLPAQPSSFSWPNAITTNSALQANRKKLNSIPEENEVAEEEEKEDSQVWIPSHDHTLSKSLSNALNPKAYVHVFYNSPPALSSKPPTTVTRHLDGITLSNQGNEYSFAALRWELIQGSNVTVSWSFKGGRPDFWVLRSKAAFDLWRQDTFPPLTYQVHHEYSTESGSYTMMDQPSDIYYFLFSAPTYFWPSFEATGSAKFDVSRAEYDVSGIDPSHPSPVLTCEINLALPTQHNTRTRANSITSRSPSLLSRILKTLWNPLFKIPNVVTDTSFTDPSRDQSLWNTTTLHSISAQPSPSQACQIFTPSPTFIKSLHILLVAPPTTPSNMGGSGRGNHRDSVPPSDDDDPVDDESGTLPPLTTLFHLVPSFRPNRGAGPVVFFVWAFCAVIGLSVCVAAGIFAAVWVVGTLVVWIRRVLGFPDSNSTSGGARGGGDEEEGTEPLPVYEPLGVDVGDDVGLVVPGVSSTPPPPEYSPLDPLLVYHPPTPRDNSGSGRLWMGSGRQADFYGDDESTLEHMIVPRRDGDIRPSVGVRTEDVNEVRTSFEEDNTSGGDDELWVDEREGDNVAANVAYPDGGGGGSGEVEEEEESDL